MTYLRHAARHVQQTIIDRVQACLDDGGWLDHAAGQGPMGTDQVTLLTRRLKESEYQDENAGNLVAITFAGEPPFRDEEMGAGLVSVEHTLYCDVIGANDSVSLAIASDLKDNLSGQAPGVIRFEPVYDYTTSPRTAVSGWSLEFTQVIRQRPDGDDYRRLWNVVSATCDVNFVGQG